MRSALSVFLVLSSCGPSATAPVPPAPQGTDSAFTQVQPIIQRDCSKCHNGSFQPAFNSSNFKSSQAMALLNAGAMPPPPNLISDSDKSALLAYLNN